MVLGIKVKGDPGRCGPERVGIHAVNDGNHSLRVVCTFNREPLRTQIKRYLRFADASGELRIQHIVDLAQARIGSVPARSAPRERDADE